MPSKFPKIGSRHTLVGPAPMGEGPGAIYPGTAVEVVEVDHTGDLEGVGAAGEPSVLVRFEEPTPSVSESEDGEQRHFMEDRPRHVSVPLDEFRQLFDEEA